MRELTHLILFLLIVIIFFLLKLVIKFIKESMAEYPNYSTFFSQNKSVAIILILFILGILYLLNILFNTFASF